MPLELTLRLEILMGPLSKGIFRQSVYGGKFNLHSANRNVDIKIFIVEKGNLRALKTEINTSLL